jgi:hypothetical protein
MAPTQAATGVEASTLEHPPETGSDTHEVTDPHYCLYDKPLQRYAYTGPST